MTNEEKKQFILSAHKLFMDYRPYDSAISLDQIKKREDEFWSVYSSLFYDLIPKTFYKYRKPTKEAIENFINDEAWFSRPSKFDDTVDSTINNDIETELEEFEKNPKIVTERLAKALVNAFANKLGISVDEKLVSEGLPLFNSDGTFNETETKQFLTKTMPFYATDECVARLKKATDKTAIDDTLKAVEGFLKNYTDMNNKTRNETLAFCLAEESDNQAMWGLCADESRGFCIEYEIPSDTFLGQRMLLNLFPIYYGEKPLIKFFDVLIRGLYSQKQINGIDYDDYQEWFLSTFTKSPTYSFEQEWRISFDNRMGGNLQTFPFAKSIILGERMEESIKKQLIEAAKKKSVKVYERKFNKCGSKIVVEELKSN